MHLDRREGWRVGRLSSPFSFMRGWLLIASLFLLSTLAAAQHTTVTGQVIDSNSQIYRSCTGTANFAGQNTTPGAGPYLLGGSVFQTVVPIFCDGAGNFTISLADNNQIAPTPSQWRFSIQTAIGSFPGPVISFNCLITITGVSQTVTAPLTVCATLLPISGITLQTDSVNNTNQGLLNFVDSATVTWSNPSGGIEQANVVSPGTTCSPLTHNAIVFVNNSGACTTNAALGYNNFTANYLTVGGNSTTGGVTVRGATSGSAAYSTNLTSTITFLQNQSDLELALDKDNALNPINYNRIRSGNVSAGNVTNTGFGLEFSGNGDPAGSGSAAGFLVNNATSTSNTSAGASNSITAGSASGTTTSPGGSNSITAGNSSGTGTGSSGGSNTITGGTASGGNNLGGDITIVGGNGAGSGRGGNINLNVGTGSPNGQVLCSGSPCLISIQSSSLTTNTGQAIGASAQTWITKAVTMPSSGCPCRALVSYAMLFTATNSGTATCWVEDGSNTFATNSALTNTAATHSMGCQATSGTPVNYTNGQVVTFVGRGYTDASGGITVASGQFGSTQASWLDILVLTSN